MSEWLFRITVEYGVWYRGVRDKSPIYAVARSKEGVRKYVEKHLKEHCTIKTIRMCGKRLGMNMYHGKPKKGEI